MNPEIKKATGNNFPDSFYFFIKEIDPMVFYRIL